MNKLTHSNYFRIISLVLIITFIALDISWAYPPDPSTQNSTLATPSLLQQQPINEQAARFRQSVFSQGAVLGSVCSIAKYLIEDKLPIKYLDQVLAAELGNAIKGINLSRVTIKDGVILIPCELKGKKRVIQMALKDNLAAKDLIGYEWVVSDKYVIKELSEDYTDIVMMGQNLSEKWREHVNKGKMMVKFRSDKNVPKLGVQMDNIIELGVRLRADGNVEFYGINHGNNGSENKASEIGVTVLPDRPVGSFLVHLNEFRGLRRGVTEKKKVGKQEKELKPHKELCQFACRDNTKTDSLLNSERIMLEVTINGKIWRAYNNASPFEKDGHFVIVPDINNDNEIREQKATAQDIKDMVTLIRNSHNLLLFFNSDHAGASVNHIHFQGVYHPQPFAAETAQAEKVFTDGDVSISYLVNYPATCLVFESAHIANVSNSIWKAVDILQQKKIPFNLIFIGPKAYLFVRDIENEVTEEFKTSVLASMEMMGKIIVVDKDTDLQTDILSIKSALIKSCFSRDRVKTLFTGMFTPVKKDEPKIAITGPIAQVEVPTSKKEQAIGITSKIFNIKAITTLALSIILLFPITALGATGDTSSFFSSNSALWIVGAIVALIFLYKMARRTMLVNSMAWRVAERCKELGVKKTRIVNGDMNSGLLESSLESGEVIVNINRTFILHPKFFKLWDNPGLIGEIIELCIYQKFVAHSDKYPDMFEWIRSRGYSSIENTPRGVYLSEANRRMYPKVGIRGAALNIWASIYMSRNYIVGVNNTDVLNKLARQLLDEIYLQLSGPEAKDKLNEADQEKIIEELFKIDAEFRGVYYPSDSERLVKLPAIEPIYAILAVSGILTILSWLKDFAFAHPIIVGIATLGLGIVAFFTIWRVFFPISWYLWLMTSSDAYLRSSTAKVLGEVKDPRAVEQLIKTLGDTDSKVRSSAIVALGNIKDPRAVEPLIKTLGDTDSKVRSSAIVALGNIKDPRAVKPLKTLIKDMLDTIKDVKSRLRKLEKEQEKIGKMKGPYKDLIDEFEKLPQYLVSTEAILRPSIVLEIAPESPQGKFLKEYPVICDLLERIYQSKIQFNSMINSELMGIKKALKSFDLDLLKNLLMSLSRTYIQASDDVLVEAFEAIQLVSDFQEREIDALFTAKKAKYWLANVDNPELEKYNAEILENFGRENIVNADYIKKMISFLGRVALSNNLYTIYERQSAVTALRMMGGEEAERFIAKALEDPFMVQREVRLPEKCISEEAKEKIISAIEWVKGHEMLPEERSSIEGKIDYLFKKKPEILAFIRQYPLRLFSVKDRQKMDSIILGDFRQYWFQVIGIIHLRQIGGRFASSELADGWREIGRTMEIMSRDTPVDMGIGIEIFKNEQLLASVIHHEWLHYKGIKSEGETLLRQANYTKAMIAEESLPLTEQKRAELESNIVEVMCDMGISSLGYYFVADLNDEYLDRLNRNILQLYGPDNLTESQILTEAEKIIASINEMIEERNQLLRERQELDPAVSLYSPLTDENKRRIIELVEKSRQIKNALTLDRFRSVAKEDRQYYKMWEAYRNAGGGHILERMLNMEIPTDNLINLIRQTTEATHFSIVASIIQELALRKKTTPQDLFILVQSKVPESMQDLRSALAELKPLSEQASVTADAISQAITQSRERYPLSDDETKILWLALAGPGQGTGEAKDEADRYYEEGVRLAAQNRRIDAIKAFGESAVNYWRKSNYNPHLQSDSDRQNLRMISQQAEDIVKIIEETGSFEECVKIWEMALETFRIEFNADYKNIYQRMSKRLKDISVQKEIRLNENDMPAVNEGDIVLDKRGGEVLRVCGIKQSTIAQAKAGLPINTYVNLAEVDFSMPTSYIPVGTSENKKDFCENFVIIEKSHATQLFDLMESSLNNERAKFIEAGQKLVEGIDKNMSTIEIKERVERTIANIEKLDQKDASPEIRASIELLKKNLNQFEADGGVASLIILARRAKRENQKLIIGLETDWIPGMPVQNSLQRNAITALMKEIDKIGEALKSMGLDNVEVIRGNSNELASALLTEADKTHTNLRNIVVIASVSTINSDSFIPLRNADEKDRPFLAGIDAAELVKLYEEFGEATTKQLYIRLTELLYVALELAAGKEPPQTPLISSYDRKMRIVIFLPKAEPMDYEMLKNTYAAEKTALAAA